MSRNVYDLYSRNKISDRTKLRVLVLNERMNITALATAILWSTFIFAIA
ncbi:MAG: hypothetical protein HWQ41_09935 [Nostoc sp. NOS(2021)]|nr:hypothetical protein [Nostoc sp. NOS(2021)]MBN3895566.1 hypothetical protein [Nostoc sp. NOS(2021)]